MAKKRKLKKYRFSGVAMTFKPAKQNSRTLMIKTDSDTDITTLTTFLPLIKTDLEKRVTYHNLYDSSQEPDLQDDFTDLDALEEALWDWDIEKANCNIDHKTAGDFRIVEKLIEKSEPNIFQVPVGTAIIALKHADNELGNKSLEMAKEGCGVSMEARLLEYEMIDKKEKDNEGFSDKDKGFSNEEVTGLKKVLNWFKKDNNNNNNDEEIEMKEIQELKDQITELKKSVEGITDLKKTVDALKESNEKLDKLFEDQIKTVETAKEDAKKELDTKLDTVKEEIQATYEEKLVTIAKSLDSDSNGQNDDVEDVKTYNTSFDI